jgi:hypothetical protein
MGFGQRSNPKNCVVTPSACQSGEVCNLLTEVCEPAGAPPMDLGPQLQLLAGALGGAGNADDTGASARFNVPSSVAADYAGNGSSRISRPSVAVL